MACGVVAVLAGIDEARWWDIRKMASREEYDVLVVARREHLPPRRRPRVVAIEDEEPVQDPPDAEPGR